MIEILLFLAAVAALAGAAFCAGAETGFLSVSRERVLHLSREGGVKAAKVQRALADMARTTTTLLIGNNLASVGYSSAFAALSARISGSNATASAVLGFVGAFMLLYCAEFMPKLLFAARPLRRILAVAGAYEVLAAALEPAVSLAMRFSDLFLPRREQKYKGPQGRRLPHRLRVRPHHPHLRPPRQGQPHHPRVDPRRPRLTAETGAIMV